MTNRIKSILRSGKKVKGFAVWRMQIVSCTEKIHLCKLSGFRLTTPGGSAIFTL